VITTQGGETSRAETPRWPNIMMRNVQGMHWLMLATNAQQICTRNLCRSSCTTRKPCCRKETARCRKCSFLLKFPNNIHYKYKTSQASKAATLQSSKHADA